MLIQSVIYKVNKLVFNTKINLNRSRDWSLLQRGSKQGAVASYSEII